MLEKQRDLVARILLRPAVGMEGCCLPVTAGSLGLIYVGGGGING